MIPTPQPPTAARGAPRATTVLGVLGGIGAGKSEVARLLAGERGVVLDADRMAREELESPELVAWLRARHGAQALDASGRPDRAALAARVFADPAARAELEQRLHPRVRARLAGELEEARRRGAPVAVLDVPLLLENDDAHGLAGLCDALVFVEADPRERERRVGAARGWQPGELARREQLQMPLERKRARAHHVIRNDGDRAALAASVAELRARLDLSGPEPA